LTQKPPPPRYVCLILDSETPPRSPRGAMSDQQLPEEVLQLIMWHLKPAFDFSIDLPDGQSENEILRETLESCVLASETLRKLIEPVFYHTCTSD
jgi:hypothetical protein